MIDLTKERAGEIALAILKAKVRKDGIPNFDAKEILRGIGNSIKEPDFVEAKVTKEELISLSIKLNKEFSQELEDNLLKGI